MIKKFAQPMISVSIWFRKIFGLNMLSMGSEPSFVYLHKAAMNSYFPSLAYGVVSDDQLLNPGPIGNSVNLFHSFDGLAVSQGRKSETAAKERLSSIFLKPMDPPRE